MFEITPFLLGTVYAWIGLFATMTVDGKCNACVERFVGDSTAMAWLVLVFWPVILPFAVMRNLSLFRRILGKKG